MVADALWCVVPAAGRGARFGGEVPKQYVDLLGRPLLLHTLERLATHPGVTGIMVVLAADDHRWPGLTVIAGKPVLTAVGGAERAASVLAGLRALPPAVTANACVLVHDAARPLLGAGDLDRLIDLGVRHAVGALLATPVRDTLKRAGEQGVAAATVARAGLWRALTPQLGRRGDLEHALQTAAAQGIEVTDESMALERIGLHPLLVEGGDDNLKITTPADLAYAAFRLSLQGHSQA
jgi:2-C-methyl-D-erythritol 4-phosphate cytidylyltransferase